MGLKKSPPVHVGGGIFGPALQTQTPSNHPAAISFCFEQLLGLAIYSARKTAESFSEGKIIYLDNYFEDGNYKRSLMVKLLKCLLLSGGKTFLCLATALVGATTLIAEPGLLCVFLLVPEAWQFAVCIIDSLRAS